MCLSLQRLCGCGSKDQELAHTKELTSSFEITSKKELLYDLVVWAVLFNKLNLA